MKRFCLIFENVSCVIGQEYGLHNVQVYKVLGFVQHEDFVS